MTRRNDAPTTRVWRTRQVGARPTRVVVAYDAADDQYYLDDDVTQEAAFVVYDATDDQYYLDTVRGNTNARLLAVPYFVRVMGE